MRAQAERLVSIIAIFVFDYGCGLRALARPLRYHRSVELPRGGVAGTRRRLGSAMEEWDALADRLCWAMGGGSLQQKGSWDEG
jgi:hypothetical protein